MAKTERKAIDKVLVLLGLVTALVLVAIGCLAWYGYRFTTQEVTSELSAQKIYFPPAGSPALAALPASDQAQMDKYAGQQLVDGQQAKVYADNFMLVHLQEIAGGQTYAQVSTAAQQDPSNQKLQAEKATLFQGETLRGLLLGDGYSYWTFALIAKWIAISSFAGAAVMAILVLLGLVHLSRLR